MTLDESFQKFWSAYPNRVAKFAARRAFDKAIKLATVEEIIAGVERYISHKPEHISYCHPASWLNGGRWEDCPAPEPISKATGNTKLIEQRRQLDELNERIKFLLGQRPLIPKLAAEFTAAKIERVRLQGELRKLL